MKHFNEGHLFGVLWAKSNPRKSLVILLPITPILRQKEWVVDPMCLPKRYAVL
jgi:hypothetical protein